MSNISLPKVLSAVLKNKCKFVDDALDFNDCYRLIGIKVVVVEDLAANIKTVAENNDCNVKAPKAEAEEVASREELSPQSTPGQ